MTRIDFYILSKKQQQDRFHFSCRLIDKAQLLGNRVYVAVNNPQEALELDEMLWQFRPESFVAHDCEGQINRRANVFIGYGDDCGDHHDLLINLKDDIPDFFSRFQRLVEVVCQDEKVLTHPREHFTFYKSRGYPINTNDLRK